MIETTKHRLKKPSPVTKDSEGTLIARGMNIAYNRQGNVVPGVILDWKTDWKVSRAGADGRMWWACKFKMTVKSGDGNLSTLTNPNSFLIIDKDE